MDENQDDVVSQAEKNERKELGIIKIIKGIGCYLDVLGLRDPMPEMVRNVVDYNES